LGRTTLRIHETDAHTPLFSFWKITHPTDNTGSGCRIVRGVSFPCCCYILVDSCHRSYSKVGAAVVYIHCCNHLSISFFFLPLHWRFWRNLHSPDISFTNSSRTFPRYCLCLSRLRDYGTGSHVLRLHCSFHYYHGVVLLSFLTQRDKRYSDKNSKETFFLRQILNPMDFLRHVCWCIRRLLLSRYC